MTNNACLWLPGLRQCRSHNFNQRPAGCEVELLVIHNISLPAGCYGGGYIEQLFSNTLDCQQHPSFSDLQGLKVSSHFLIDRFGVITQFVALNQRAWHAGQSSYLGRDNCNDFSIGIELEGCDNSPYSSAQYQALTDLSLRLFQLYPKLNAATVTGHSDIAPGRKTDPGPAFDWAHYFYQLNGACE